MQHKIQEGPLRGARRHAVVAGRCGFHQDLRSGNRIEDACRERPHGVANAKSPPRGLRRAGLQRLEDERWNASVRNTADWEVRHAPAVDIAPHVVAPDYELVTILGDVPARYR